MLNKIIEHLSGFIYPNSLYGNDVLKCIEWLKSLRPFWKPREEQMEALQNAERLVRPYYPEHAKILAELYEQLKAL